MSEVILETKRLCKDYGPVRVLFDVDCSLRRGEVHALLGENGAGKSTLMKVLAGYLRPTSGQILLDGRPVSIPRSAVGERLGIVLIHQEFNLAPDLTVEENIFLGHELCRGPFVDRRQMVEACAQVLRELETDIDPRVRVSSLTVSEKQMVEIAKAVSRQARILIMDEPTAVLTDRETEVLFRLIRRLKQAGVTIVYISHKLHEVQAISDRVTVLRDGYVVATHPTAALTQDEMASLMVVRDIHDMFPPKLPVSAGEEVLSVERVSVPGWAHEVSFALRRGEILGFFGLVGSGRTELMEGIVGLRPLSGGVIRRNGRRVEIRSLRRRWARRTPAALAGVLRASFYV